MKCRVSVQQDILCCVCECVGKVWLCAEAFKC